MFMFYVWGTFSFNAIFLLCWVSHLWTYTFLFLSHNHGYNHRWFQHSLLLITSVMVSLFRTHFCRHFQAQLPFLFQLQSISSLWPSCSQLTPTNWIDNPAVKTCSFHKVLLLSSSFYMKECKSDNVTASSAFYYTVNKSKTYLIVCTDYNTDYKTVTLR